MMHSETDAISYCQSLGLEKAWGGGGETCQSKEMLVKRCNILIMEWIKVLEF